MKDPNEGKESEPCEAWRIENFNCHGDNEAPDGVVSDVVRTTSQNYPHGMEIDSFASKCKWWRQKMHLRRLRKKTTMPKMYMWEVPPSACVGASPVSVWLYK